MPPKSKRKPPAKRKTTTRVTRRTVVGGVKRVGYEVLRPAAELAKEVEAIWLARDADCVKSNSFYPFEDSGGSLGRFAGQNVVSDRMLQAVNDRFDSFNDFSLIVEEAKPPSRPPSAMKRGCQPTNGVDSPLPKADRLSLDVFGNQGADEVDVEPVAGPSTLASRRSHPIEDSGRDVANIPSASVKVANAEASAVPSTTSHSVLRTPARRSPSKTSLQEVFHNASRRITSNDLMAIPSQKTVFVSTPVNTNRKSFRIDVSPIGKRIITPLASTRRTKSSMLTDSPRGQSILPPTPTAESSNSTVSVLPPTEDESEISPMRITFDDAHTPVPAKKSILKQTQHAESTTKSATTTIQSLNFGNDESKDMFEDSGPGFGDVGASAVSVLNTESHHVSKMAEEVSKNVLEDSGSAFGDVVMSAVDSKAVSVVADASNDSFVTPIQSMNASKRSVASFAPVVESEKSAEASVVESEPITDASAVSSHTVPGIDSTDVEMETAPTTSPVKAVLAPSFDDSASNRTADAHTSKNLTDSITTIQTPFVSVRKSHRPSVKCDTDKENSIVSSTEPLHKSISVSIDKPEPEAVLSRESDVIPPTSLTKSDEEDDDAELEDIANSDDDAEDDVNEMDDDESKLEAVASDEDDAEPEGIGSEDDEDDDAELEAIANNRAMSHSPIHRTESQMTNRTNVDSTAAHGLSRANESCRSDITVASSYTTFTVKADDPNKELFYLEGFAGEASDLNHLCFVSGQSSVQPWRAAIRHLDLSEATKIGEGAFGEVYVAKLNGMKVALKVFPFRESDDPSKRYPLVNESEMMPAAPIMSEVVVTKTLSGLSEAGSRAPNFVPLHKTFVVKGTYPKELLNAWHAYDKRKGSENTCPTDYDSVTRHYIVMALGFGGVDLESYVLRSYNKAMSILLQVALALAVAEVELEFEHRDLHWGNILICEEDVPEFIEYVIEGKEIRVRSHGVKVVIIDFTNSRIFKDGVIVYVDLSQDEVIFEGQGDPQFQVYRDMRALNGDDWSLYKPESNVLWLGYLIDKLFNGVKGKRPNFNKKQRDEAVEKFNFVRECTSTFEFLEKSCSMFADFYGCDTDGIFA